MTTGGASRRAAVSSLFNPARVVVLGASARRPASGNLAVRNLLASGHLGAGLHVVHPTADVIEGVRVTRSVSDLDPDPDVALVSLPGHSLMAAVQELEKIGTRAAVVPTAGLDASTQRALEDFAASSPMAVHGNNCMGILSPAGGVPLWFYGSDLAGVAPGGISLVSQSGSALFLTRAVEHAGFARIVSTGNEIGLTSADHLQFLATDPATRTVGLVAEAVRDEPAFTAAVDSLRRAGKPLVALKVGLTDAGRRATLAHTGALLSTSQAVVDYFRELDVPLVRDYDELAVALQVLDHGIRPAGPRIAVITDSGGEAALAADLAAGAGVHLRPFTASTTERLTALTHGSAVDNPFDAGANPLTTDPEYDESYLVVAQDPDVDAVVVVVEGHGSISERQARGVGDMLGSSTRRALEAGKPVIAASSSSTATHPLLPRVLGVPVVRGISNALVALRAAAANRAPVRPPVPRPEGLPDAAGVSGLRDRLRAHGAGSLPLEHARELLGAYGVRLATSVTASTQDDAVAWARGRYPVVAKIASPDVAHRSDVGGVATGLPDEPALRAAYDAVLTSVARHRPDARIDGVEVQEHVGGSAEAIVGLATDPVLGASVVVGAGGVLVELVADAASARAPVDAGTARELVEGTALGRLLGGHRALHPPTDTAPLADLVVRLSWLGHDLRGVVAAVDLNPVLVEDGTGRVVLVDALVVVGAVEPR